MALRLLLPASVLCLLAAIACGGKAEPGTTVINFHHHVESGNNDAAMSLLSTEFAESAGKTNIEAYCFGENSRIKERGGIKSVDIEKEEITDGSATVKFKVTYGNAETMNGEWKLIKEGEVWKITRSK